MYNPSVGRFTSADPKGFAAGDPNLYRFVGNAPTNATDPSGMLLIAVGDDARDEALWHLKHTFKLKDDAVAWFDIGVASDKVWEKNSAKDHLFLIAPNPAYGEPKSKGSAPDKAIEELWQAFSDPKVNRIAGRINLKERPIPIKDQPTIQWGGNWHKRPDALAGVAEQFHIGTQFDLGILSPQQRIIAHHATVILPAIVARLKETTDEFTTYSGGPDVPAIPRSGVGPCIHAVARLMEYVQLDIKTYNVPKGSIDISYLVFDVDQTKAIVDGLPVDAKRHIIVQITFASPGTKPAIMLFDGGIAAKGYGNIGNAIGIVDPKVLKEWIDKGALTKPK